MSGIIEKIARLGVLPVISVSQPEWALPLADALLAGGLSALEVTLRSDAALTALSRIHAERPQMTFCAGTVRTPAQARAAVAAGAACIVAPGFREDVAQACREMGVTYLPACVTGTELETALDAGLEAVKFFPAGPLGGPAALRLLSGPYSGLRFIPTGGITIDNLAQYLALPAVAACGGSFMAPAELLRGGEWAEITARCRRCVEIAWACGRGE